MADNKLPKNFDKDEIKAKKLRSQSDDHRMQLSAQRLKNKRARELERIRLAELKKNQPKVSKPKSSNVDKNKVKISKPKIFKPEVVEDKAVDYSKFRPSGQLPKPSDKKMPGDIEWATNPKMPKPAKVKSNQKVNEVRVGDLANLSRYDLFVDKVNSITDIKQLKKMIYNRNYGIKKKYIEDNPEVLSLKYIIINDMRHIKQTTFDRVNAIRDPQKQLEALRKLLIDNTRRTNKPKVYGDYSNREHMYMNKAMESLKDAVASWDDEELKIKVGEVLEFITMEDVQNIFRTIPSYWAISEGYYYAIADFSNFMEELFKLINQGLERSGKDILTASDKAEMSNKLFRNVPDPEKLGE